MSNFTYSFKDMNALALYLEGKGQNFINSAKENEQRKERRYSKAKIAEQRTVGNTYLSIADMLKHTELSDQPAVHRQKMELGDLYGGVLF